VHRPVSWASPECPLTFAAAAMGIGISQDTMGMSFSYRDLIGVGVSAGSTPTPGGLQQAYDFLERGIGMSADGAHGIASDL